MRQPSLLQKARPDPIAERQITISAGPEVALRGDLTLPDVARGMIIVPHAARASRRTAYNLAACNALNRDGLATLLLDCLTPHEKANMALRKGSRELAERLAAATERFRGRQSSAALPFGYLAHGSAAQVALLAAARVSIGAIVLLGPPAEEEIASLEQLSVPILLIAGGGVGEHRSSTALRRRLGDIVALEVIPGAGFLGDGDPGPHVRAFNYAAAWFARHLHRSDASSPPLAGQGVHASAVAPAYGAGPVAEGASGALAEAPACR